MRNRKQQDPILWADCILGGLRVAPHSLVLTVEFLAGLGKWSSLPGFRERLLAGCGESPLTAFKDLTEGLRALSGDDTVAAERHFEAAHLACPGNPIIANNLAALIGTRRTGLQSDRAIGIINRVLGDHPNEAAFLDTRGLIFLRAGNLTGAVASLESALIINPQPGTRLALAEAYARLGRHEDAAAQRDAAAGAVR